MDQVNDIINNLCDKLGTTVEYLAPEYAKMKIADAQASILVAVIIFAVFVVTFTGFLIWLRLIDRDRLRSLDGIIMVFAIMFCALGLACIVYFVCTLSYYVPAMYRYNASPVAALFEDALRLMPK